MRVLLVTIAGVASLVLAGCTLAGPETRIAGTSALHDATVTIAPNPDGMLHATITFPGDDQGSVCTVLASDVTATYAGMPVVGIDRGRVLGKLDSGGPFCSPPDLTLAAKSDAALDRRLDAQVDLAVRDSAGEAHATAVGPFAPRVLTPNGGGFASGGAAVVTWTGSGDRWAPTDGSPYTGTVLECDSPDTTTVFAATTTTGLPPASWRTTLTVRGSTLSFIVPVSTYAGPLQCSLNANAFAPIAVCDFASCDHVVPLPVDSRGYYAFTSTMLAT